MKKKPLPNGIRILLVPSNRNQLYLPILPGDEFIFKIQPCIQDTHSLGLCGSRAGLCCLAVGKTKATSQNPQSPAAASLCDVLTGLLTLSHPSSEPLSSGRQNVAASNSQLDMSALSTPDRPNLALSQFHVPRKGGLVSLNCVMVLLGLERTPETPQHPLSSPDFKALEKRMGRRSKLSTLSPVKVAKMYRVGLQMGQVPLSK